MKRQSNINIVWDTDIRAITIIKICSSNEKKKKKNNLTEIIWLSIFDYRTMFSLYVGENFYGGHYSSIGSMKSDDDS